jgi:hypothetical protein
MVFPTLRVSGPTCLPGGKYINIIYFVEPTCLLGFSYICLGFLLLLEYSILVKGYIWRLIPPTTTNTPSWLGRYLTMMFPSGIHSLAHYAMILPSWLHRPCYW